MADRQGWSTRVGGPSKSSSDVPPPSADLASMMPSTSNRAREREATAQARLEEARKRQEAMERRAARARRNERMRTIIRSRGVLALAVGIVSILVFATVVLPKIQRALDPPLTQQQLEQEMSIIRLRATKTLKADLGTPSISSPDSSTFRVKFIARRGEKMLSGKKITSGCSVTYTIDRLASKIGELQIQQGRATTCKPSR